jgi:hypothetical protein
MGGGSLSDQQLKEFDEYLSGAGSSQPSAPKPESKPEVKPEPVVQKTHVDDDYIDEIPKLHQKKVDGIYELLDKIDAKTHKDIVADLVDELQYQKGVIKREKDQAEDLKKLFSLAAEAGK